jgi:hypothetical protein
LSQLAVGPTSGEPTNDSTLVRVSIFDEVPEGFAGAHEHVVVSFDVALNDRERDTSQRTR